MGRSLRCGLVPNEGVCLDDAQPTPSAVSTLGVSEVTASCVGGSIERTAAPSRPHQHRVEVKKPWSAWSALERVFKVGTTERMKP
jgi:hypothetical protein